AAQRTTKQPELQEPRRLKQTAIKKRVPTGHRAEATQEEAAEVVRAEAAEPEKGPRTEMLKRAVTVKKEPRVKAAARVEAQEDAPGLRVRAEERTAESHARVHQAAACARENRALR
ncbi:MAG: hypothetical protein IME99_02325, partial [Proteobacteria bacterium]|nr:hypothetical protein [Pseudomonadota bacterium]